MSSPDIKEIVKEKYGQAALRVTSAAVPAAARRPVRDAAIRSHRICMTHPRHSKFPKKLCWPPLGCGIQPLWPV